MYRRKSSGFTLVELLVVIAIIGILSTVLYATFGEGSAQGRDAKRQADLRNVESALELYKMKYGRYPEGCRGADRWSGQSGTVYACPSGAEYIIDLAPEFLASLPRDPKLNGNDSGYVYVTNTDGSVYKFEARKTVETVVVDYNNEFKSCDVSGLANVSCSETDVPPLNSIEAALDRCDAASCDRTTSAGNNKPTHCEASNSVFRTSYAVWGGYHNLSPTAPNAEVTIERRTESVICDIP